MSTGTNRTIELEGMIYEARDNNSYSCTGCCFLAYRPDLSGYCKMADAGFYISCTEDTSPDGKDVIWIVQGVAPFEKLGKQEITTATTTCTICLADKTPTIEFDSDIDEDKNSWVKVHVCLDCLKAGVKLLEGNKS